ncbi:hypothetical protein Poly51_39320 [Rubripirellula tenax]|uniref:Uncharacterized protein n=1 Tax=Rubripirellula tenax TaxID=2528015 RepID=A0A5C6ET48_9BACT|nr:hypothetical protein Poly51_39320 [Rubripirellula tenax]
MLGVASNATGDETPDVRIHGNHPGFLVRDVVSVSEDQLRHWFGRLLTCWPTEEDIDNGYPVPQRDERRRCPPDVGFILTGDVCEEEGFVVSWAGGTVRGSASGCIMSFDFDRNRECAAQIRREIETYYKQECG